MPDRYVIMRNDYSAFLTQGDGRIIFTDNNLELARKCRDNYSGHIVPESLCTLHLNMRKIINLFKQLDDHAVTCRDCTPEVDPCQRGCETMEDITRKHEEITKLIAEVII